MVLYYDWCLGCFACLLCFVFPFWGGFGSFCSDLDVSVLLVDVLSLLGYVLCFVCIRLGCVYLVFCGMIVNDLLLIICM